MNLKQYATKEKPTQEGYYLWWDEDDYIHPHESLVLIQYEDGELCANFYFGSSNDFSPLKDVADRLWYKVKY